jgi:hypothetical protein
MTDIDLIEARRLQKLALALADAAARSKDPADVVRLEQAALRAWQASRRHFHVEKP